MRSTSFRAALRTAALALCVPGFGQDLPSQFQSEEVLSDLDSPCSLEFAPDGRMFVSERIEGRLRVATYDVPSAQWILNPQPFYTFDVPKDANGNPEEHRSSGLRNVAFDPDFATNGYVYAFYMLDNPRQNRVVRIQQSASNPDVATPGSEVLLLDMPYNTSGSSGSHNGGAVEFGPDGCLYVTTGDGWSGGDAVQSLATFTGKVLRIHPDGSIPIDNPFFGQATGDLRAIYCLGLRNPFSMSSHPTSGALYVNEANGPSKAQIYVVGAAANYGHQGYGGIGVSTSAWANAAQPGGTLITGGDWYPFGGPFPAQYHGAYFAALWGSNGSQGGPPGDLHYVVSEADPTVQSFADNVGAVDASGQRLKPIHARVGPEGDLYYVLTSYMTGQGSVHRIVWTGQSSVATPGITPDGGNFADPVQVTLATSTGGATIHYTLDGTDPSRSAPLYSTPFFVNASGEVRARAFRPDLLPSSIAAAPFTIGNPANVPPVAIAGADQTAGLGDFVTLNGAASDDPDGSNLFLSESWAQIGGPPVTLLNADEAAAFFTPTVLGRYDFQITVSDGFDATSDTTSVTVIPCVSDVQDGLVARWAFEEGVGSVALDSAGGLLNGSIVGPQWSVETPDGQGRALRYNGVDDAVHFADIDVSGAAVSFTAWIRASDLDVQDARILSKATGVQDADHYWMISTLQSGGAHRLRFRLKAGGQTSTLIAAAGGVVPGEWTHVAGVYDGASMQLFQDGVLVGTLPKTGALSTNPAVDAALGNQPPGAGARPFDGWIDEVRIYDRALRPAEVRFLADFDHRPDCRQADQAGAPN